MQEKKIGLLMESVFCNPRLQSVSLIGYKWFREMQDLTDLTLITHSRNRESLEPLRKSCTNIVYIDTGIILQIVYRINKRCPVKISAVAGALYNWLDYKIFTLAAKNKVKTLLKNKHFDIHHVVTPVALNTHSAIVSLGLPSIIGPLNSNMKWPKGFVTSEYATNTGHGYKYGLFRRLIEIFMGSSRWAQYRRILVATRAAADSIPQRFKDRQIFFCENGVDSEDFGFQIHNNPVTKCLYVGRLIPFKAVDIAILAFHKALLKNRGLELVVVGNGTELGKLYKLVDDMNIGSNVKFVSEVSNTEVIQYFQEADIFLLSSLRESGGAVVLEAMSCGAVPIVVEHGGPSEIVSDAIGVGIKPVTKNQLIDDFAAAILTLAGNVRLRHGMAARGRRLIKQEYDWRGRARRMLEIYNAVLRDDEDSHTKDLSQINRQR